MIFNVIIRQIVDSITIREIDDREYFNFDYVNLNIYLKNKLKKNSSIVYIKRNVYIINNLKIKMLIDIDIICSKNITTNLQIRNLIINNYNITTFITCTFVDFKINRIVKFHHVVIISTYTMITISFKTQNFDLLNDKNYFFQSHIISLDFKIENNIITHVMNVNIFMIHVRNVINKSITMSKYIKLNKIIDFDEKNYYYVDNTNIYLTIDIN